MKSSILLLAAWVAFSIPARAQDPVSPPPPGSATPRWEGHVAVLAGNVALGALTGGVLRLLRGGSFGDGLVRGALGGAVSYTAKRIVVQRFPGAGLLGREVNAVGVSIVRNAADGVPTFSRLFLPLGPLPVRARVTLAGGFGVEPRLDLGDALWLADGLATSGLRLDVGESVSSGAPVFQAAGRWLDNGDHDTRGYAVSRAIFLGDPTLYQQLPAPPALVLSHERVHVLQQDFVLTAWSDPLADATLARLGPGRWVSRYVAVDALGWVPGMMSRLSYGADGRDRSPAELEARFLAQP